MCRFNTANMGNLFKMETSVAFIRCRLLTV